MSHYFVITKIGGTKQKKNYQQVASGSRVRQTTELAGTSFLLNCICDQLQKLH